VNAELNHYDHRALYGGAEQGYTDYPTLAASLKAGRAKICIAIALGTFYSHKHSPDRLWPHRPRTGFCRVIARYFPPIAASPCTLRNSSLTLGLGAAPGLRFRAFQGPHSPRRTACIFCKLLMKILHWCHRYR
jgi:hypothetical protein